VFVVSENFVLWTRVQNRQRIHPPQKVFNLTCQYAAAAVSAELAPALFECLMNGFGQRLARRAGNLASQALRVIVLDAQRHNMYYILCYTILPYDVTNRLTITYFIAADSDVLQNLSK